jgi:hypothetical protein
LTAIATALAGRAGARLARRLGIAAGRDTMLKLLRSVPEPVPPDLTAIAVDDFALRRGHVYATVVVNMLTHRPVEVLPGRDAQPLADWLREHPGIQVICRDRASAYAEGARTGAPQSIQVADRWHLWHNLGQAVDKTVAAHHGCVLAHLTPPAPAPPPAEPDEVEHADDDVELATGAAPPRLDPARDVCGRERVVVARTQQRHADVQRLLAEGVTITGIGRSLGLDRTTVRRFARTPDVSELLVKATQRESLLDGYTQHLHARLAAGVDNAAVLYSEIRALGYIGSVQTVRRFVHPRRHGNEPGHPRTHHGPSRAGSVEIPKPRQISRWIMTDPAHLDPDDTTRLGEILNACPELQATAEHVRAFADIMNKRRGDRIHDWLDAITTSGLPALRSLATGLRRDLDAVIAGLSTPWNSGPAEGNVNRIILRNQ